MSTVLQIVFHLVEAELLPAREPGAAGFIGGAPKWRGDQQTPSACSFEQIVW
jgi:hypothetical protein